MEDLIVNFIGATAFSFIGYLYIHNRDKYKFASNFIPIKYKDNSRSDLETEISDNEK